MSAREERGRPPAGCCARRAAAAQPRRASRGTAVHVRAHADGTARTQLRPRSS